MMTEECYEDQCGMCRHNRSGLVSIRVDGRTADEYEDWACAREDEFTEGIEEQIEQGKCPLFERCTEQEVTE